MRKLGNETFADRHGLRREDIDSLVFVLTGMRGIDFSMADVSKRDGFGFANNLYLTYKRELGFAPVSVGRRFARKGM